MDYKNTLINYLLSENNIQYVVDLIMCNLMLAVSAIPKCKKIITQTITKYVYSLSVYPQTDAELMEFVATINKQCYIDFSVYLSNKYPNKNIYKTSTEFNQNPSPVPNSNLNFTILTEDEKNKLLEQNGMTSNSSVSSDVFLEYLTNPAVLQMFQLMINQLNQFNPQNTINNRHVDMIMTEDEVYKILKNNSESIPTKKITSSKVETIKDVDKVESESESESDIEEQIEENELVEPIPIDLTKNITSESLLQIEKRIKAIVESKNNYMKQKNNSNSADIDIQIDKLDLEKKQLITAVYDYRKSSDRSVKENSAKIKTISFAKRNLDADPNTEYLDLKLDPSDDFNDLKSIIIKIKSENKISEIVLVDYYIPFNANNINRFNNVFAIYMADRPYRVIIPPAKYSIQTLLNYIKSQINFLDFIIDKETQTITMSNTMNTKFDLSIDTGTIFPVLGFSHKSATYKDKVSYTSSSKYDLECNEKVLFVLSGTSMDPLPLEFDKKVAPAISLKKVRSGFTLKQLILQFSNGLGQYYDFIMPINICLKISYIIKT